MTTIESILLALVQGLTEFLPVSSSGHLLLVSRLYNLQCDLLMIVLLHLGTLIAVVITYYREIIDICKHPIADSRLLKLIVASVPAFVIALIVRFLLPEELLGGSLLPIGFCLTIFMLTTSKYLSKNTTTIAMANYKQITLIGLSQGMAILPGLSRSGATISTMKLIGIDNQDASQFSFLLSIPIILASAVGQLITTDLSTIATPWYNYLIGVVVAMLSGLVAIHTVRRVLRRQYWLVFAVYLLIPLTLSLIIM